MALPININDLINGHTIEWDRLEFKKGWNPEDVVHSICAFANDINNWGGGYIIIGIEENSGRPVLPPLGVNPGHIDCIQGELVKICHQIRPNYLPVVQPYLFQGKHILIIWVPAGDIRPYSAPSTQGKNFRLQHYIRIGGRSIVAQDENLRRLQELTARIPFDDRINHQASVEGFDFGLIRSFLQEVKSDLFEESAKIPFNDLCRQLYIAKGLDEALRPVNAGLLFFTKAPEIYFERAWLEVVIREDEAGKDYKEKYFKGPIHIQLRNALNYIRDNIIHEKVKKIPGRAEANRFYNFPFDAIEEALSNAVYHKSYELNKPIEVQIWPDKIEILSFPGPVPPVNAKVLASHRRIVSRDYRNRRIGDFLKELHLTEGRGTGFPTIYNAMEGNGSPMPVFETDNDCTYFLTVLNAHPDVNRDQDSDQDNTLLITTLEEIENVLESMDRQDGDQDNGLDLGQVKQQIQFVLNEKIHDKVLIILQFLQKSHKLKDVLGELNLKYHTNNKRRYIDPLIDLGYIEMTLKDALTSKNQKYIITSKGASLLKIIG